jgi:putative MATE family efflux protein
LILTSVLQLLFNAADLVIVGRFCGSVSVAAVGATGAITNLVINLFIGFSVGAGVTVAHGLGAREEAAVHRTVHTALPTAMLGGAVLTVIGVIFSEDLLIMMGTPESVLPLSKLYMQIYFGGMVFNMVYNFAASILRAAGDTKSPLIFLSLAGVVNVGLNVIFVTVFHMNVAGVALATTISQAISAILVTITLMRRKDGCRLYLKKMRFYKVQLLKMIRIGLPAGLQSSLFSISNVMIQSSINSFGEVVMSGNASAGNLEGFIYVLMNAFHQTTVNFVGQNVGARKYDRVKKTLYLCLACVTVAGLASSVLMYAFAPKLLSIYITDSPEAIASGIVRMSVVCLTYFLCGLMDTSTGALRGMGASMTPMIISVLGVCGVRLGWIFTIFQIPQFHTPWWLYVSYPISWLFTFAAQFLAFQKLYKQRLKMLGIASDR